VKNTIQKLNPIFLLNTIVFVVGSVANIYFALLAAGYMTTILLVYLVGNKIKDHVVKIGYIWVAKWSVFVAFLMLSGIYLPDVFLYSLAMFIIFNLSVNPSNVMLKKETNL